MSGTDRIPADPRRPEALRRSALLTVGRSYLAGMRVTAHPRRGTGSGPVRRIDRQLAWQTRLWLIDLGRSAARARVAIELTALRTPASVSRIRAAVTALVMVGIAITSGATAASAATITFSSVYSTNTTGDIMIRGNTLMTCPTSASTCVAARNTVGGGTATNGNLNDNNYTMTYVDIDSDSTTFDSSSSTVDMPAGSSVLFAALVWSGRSTNAAKNQALFRAPGDSAYTLLTATTLDTNSTAYQGYVDVTSRVSAAGNGSYTVANVQSATGADQYAGWALAIAYQNPDLPARNLSMFRGFGAITSTQNGTISISGFSTPPAGAVKTTLGAVSWEGDMGSAGDQFKLGATSASTTNISDALHASTNFFDSVISDKGVDSSTRNPKYNNQLGMDIGTFTADGILPNGATSAYMELSSTSETFYPGLITFAHDLYAPNIDMNKTVSVVKASGNTNPSLVEPGDQLEYTLTGQNVGQDNARYTVLTDTTPAGTTYVPGSITRNGTAKTDAAGDDEAKYTSGNHTITVNLGTGATATQGGVVNINASTETVRFRVTVDAVTDQASISNTAAVNYSGVLFTGSISGASSTATAVAVQHRSNLSVTKARDLSLVQKGAGTVVTYTLTAANAGPYADPAATVTDTLPSGAVVSSVTPSQGSCTTPSGQVVCNLGSLGSGATATVTVRAVLDAVADPATNAVTISGSNFDPDTSNNSSSVRTAVNTAPVAGDDSVTTASGTVTFNPRTNDSDADGDSLTVTAPTTTTPNRGSVVVNGNNTITYTAAAGQAGTDTFTYSVDDGRGGTATATVTVTIPNTAPVAADDATTVAPGQSATVSVLANDSDANIPTVSSQSLSVSAVTQPAGGVGTVSTNGTTVTFVPDPSFRKGTTTFTYTVSDGAGGTATANVTVTVPDDAPVAADDSAGTPSQTAVDVDVLANDTDDNGDALSLVSVTGATHGAATLVGSGVSARVHYVPDAGWFGADTMTYTITDGAHTVTAALTVTTASAAPVAGGFAATVDGGTGTAIDVLAHVTDPDTAPSSLHVVGTTGPSHGSVSVGANDLVTYTPDPAYRGADSFTYTVSDPQGNTATATVTLTVRNQAPHAHNDSAVVAGNGQVDVGVLLNDTDPNGDTLTVSAVSTPANGAATINPDGTVRYAPNANFTGSDAFTYTIDDGHGGTDTATVTVSVANLDPVAGADSAIHTGTPGAPMSIDVLANDTDPNGDTVALDSISVTPAHGTATVTSGHVVYTPDPSYVGTDTFQYQISDGAGGLANGTVTVDVRNADPTPTDDTVSAASGMPVTTDVAGNDSDPDGESLTLVSVSSPAHGTTYVTSGGRVTYTPTVGYTGSDSYTYVVRDPRGGTATGHVAVTVSNAVPVAQDTTTSTPATTPVSTDLGALVSDPDGQATSVVSVNNGTHGSVTYDPTSGLAVYTPNAGFAGTDMYCYTASDGNGGTAIGCVTVSVGNALPVANDDAAVTTRGKAVTVNVLANDTDPNGDALTVTAARVTGGRATVSVGTGGLAITPAAGFTGTVEVSYDISDGNGGTATATVRVYVAEPGATSTESLDMSQVVRIEVGSKDKTIDPADTITGHGKVTVNSMSAPATGVTVALVGGELVVSKVGDYHGTTRFTYTAIGADGVLVTVHVTVHVLATKSKHHDSTPHDNQASALPHTGGVNLLPIGLVGLMTIGLGSLMLFAAARRDREALMPIPVDEDHDVQGYSGR